MELKIFCDGGARGNPGPSAIGVAAEIRNPKSEIRNIFKISKRIGFATNNQAEYKAVIHALRWINENKARLDKKIKRIRFFLDSSLVVNQLNGSFKIKNSKLRELLLTVRGLENQIKTPVAYRLVPREKNKEADRLVNQALDSRQNR